MSTVVPPQGHRHTKCAVLPPAQTNPNNSQAHSTNSQTTMNYSTQPTTPPRTPRKEAQLSSQPRTNSTTGSKQKSRNKRPKNVMTSPAVVRYGRKTPPLAGTQSAGMPSSTKPISTPSTAAYAGPTFHASPAPSTLPIPSFYSKSVPESPGIHAMKSLKETRLSESPTPATFSNIQQQEESPLDFFFKADREEKARARSASSTQTAVPTAGPFQPPAIPPRASQTPPAVISQNRPHHSNRNSSSGMFAMELDGESTAGTPYGPAFSTPYSERINAAKFTRSYDQLPQAAQHTMSSEALKAYLFSGYPPPSSSVSFSSDGENKASSSLTQDTQRTASNPGAGSRNSSFSSRAQTNHLISQDIKHKSQNHRNLGRSSGLRQEVTPKRTPTETPDGSAHFADSPTTSRIYGNSSPSHIPKFTSIPTTHSTSMAPALASSDGNADIRGMEDSLRKILKLDSTSSNVQPGVGGLQTASTSVPGYVGGRSQ
jgi:hypothetical protein